MNRNAQLQDLMLRYSLRRREIAELLGKPLNSASGYSNSTVDRWLAGDHQVPGPILELLKLKLTDREWSPDPWQHLIRQPLPYASQRDLESDLAQVLDTLASSRKLPRVPLTAKPEVLRRAGYWLELIAHFGGPRFASHRQSLLDAAAGLRRYLGELSTPIPLRRGDQRPANPMDDLAGRWQLSRGTDMSRFRQLAHTGHV